MLQIVSAAWTESTHAEAAVALLDAYVRDPDGGVRY